MRALTQHNFQLGDNFRFQTCFFLKLMLLVFSLDRYIGYWAPIAAPRAAAAAAGAAAGAAASPTATAVAAAAAAGAAAAVTPVPADP